jgi:hypothetical protein
MKDVVVKIRKRTENWKDVEKTHKDMLYRKCQVIPPKFYEKGRKRNIRVREGQWPVYRLLLPI